MPHDRFDWRALRHAPVVVAGAGRSGTAVAELLSKRGWPAVLLTDAGPVPMAARERLEAAGVRWEQGGHSEQALAGEWLVVSPGVPDSSPLVRRYAETGRPVLAELEVASWFARQESPEGRIVAVTGTNGKTTVTSWLADMWTRDGRPFRAGGNLGTPLSALLEGLDERTDLVLEVSSFQLDHVETFRPDVAVLLNITPDHLDRYRGSFPLYAAAKARIAGRQASGDVFIFNLDDPECRRIAEELHRREDAPTLLGFSVSGQEGAAAWVENEQIHLDTTRRFGDSHSAVTQSNSSDSASAHSTNAQANSSDSADPHSAIAPNHAPTFLMSTANLALPGSHNLGNSLAAALAARVSELRNEAIRESLERFQGVPHRLETVRMLDGVRYVNDSKATNVNAVWYALDSFQQPIVLILGGRDKGNRYQELEAQLRSKVRAVLAIGESREQVARQVGAMVPDVVTMPTLDEAVLTARRLARRGDVVLLSPACSSFDMFEGYEQRGDVFRRLVHELP